MPKVDKDNQLSARVAVFVAGERSYEAAASRLGVKTATLWRFVKKGAAIARTRNALESGLAKVESEMKRPSPSSPAQGVGGEAFFVEDLQEMRALCSRMVAWIDMVELALVSSRATGRPEEGQHGGQDGR